MIETVKEHEEFQEYVYEVHTSAGLAALADDIKRQGWRAFLADTTLALVHQRDYAAVMDAADTLYEDFGCIQVGPFPPALP